MYLGRRDSSSYSRFQNCAVELASAVQLQVGCNPLNGSAEPYAHHAILLDIQDFRPGVSHPATVPPTTHQVRGITVHSSIQTASALLVIRGKTGSRKSGTLHKPSMVLKTFFGKSSRPRARHGEGRGPRASTIQPHTSSLLAAFLLLKGKF